MDGIASRSAIDRLGKRLAQSALPGPEDLHLLSELQRSCAASLDPLLAAVADVVGGPVLMARGARVHVSHRVKTRETLTDKLRRGTSLSRMQDIVGARFVGDFGVGGQDELVGRIVARFPDVRVDDRRVRPSQGYRAVHVIPTIAGHQVEIQVRTTIQHAWANTTERLADEWGRGIRYGERPTGGSEDEIRRRSEQLACWIEASDSLWRIEGGMEAELTGGSVYAAGGGAVDAAVPAMSEDPRRAVDEAMMELRRTLARGGLEVGDALKTALAAAGYSRPS